MVLLARLHMDPRSPLTVVPLERGDLGFERQRRIDEVAAVEKREAVVLGDRERKLAAVRRDHSAPFEIDRQRRASAGVLDLTGEHLDGGIFELDREHAVLKTVRVEDEA